MKLRTRYRAACRPWRHRRSDTKNEIGLQEGPLSAPQADTSSHSKHGSDTDSQGGGISLEMVISRDSAASCHVPYCEVQLALPPVHWSVLPAAPSLVSHIDVSSERVVLIVCEDVREFHLEAVPFVINHNLLAG